MTEVITRFPPSPTGNLHLGTARTAIFNYLFAKSQGGKMLLRLEDTDQERSNEESVTNIMEGLAWLGIEYDGEPVKQSERLDIYREHVQILLDKGLAYEDKDPERGTAIRLRSNKKVYSYHDLILGDSKQEAFDTVILKSDGFPTYHLAVVVDDHLMGVTHVIRGNDLFASMPLQVALYDAFGWEPPQYAHLPMILGPDKKKLSKRHGATSISEYRDAGYVPEAMFNFLTLLGWSPGNDQEMISRQETIEKFDLKRCKKAAAVFDIKKFEWMNKDYIKLMPVEELARRMETQLAESGFDFDSKPEGYLHKLIELYHERLDHLNHFVPQARIFFGDEVEFNEKDLRKVLQKDKAKSKELLTVVKSKLVDCEWTVEAMDTSLRALAESMELGFGKVAQPVRVAVTGTRVSPGLFETLEILGRDIVIKRLDRVIDTLLD